VAGEPRLAGAAVVGHRSLRQVAALVGLDRDAAGAADRAEPGHREDECEPESRKIPHGGGDHITRVAWRQRADPLYTSRMKSLSFVLVTLVACAGTQEESITPGPGVAPAARQRAATTSSDVVFELPVSTIKTAPLEPSALDRPAMPLVEAKRRTTLDKQRALVQSTRDPVAKQAQAAILATMLYLDSKAGKGNEKELLAEARRVLRDVAQLAGDAAVDELTLRLLGSYEVIAEDYAAAEKAWQGVIDKDPKSKELLQNRAWLAFTQLKQFKNAEALATLAADKLDDKQPELAYVIAWAKLRANDGPGAWQAILTAVKGWGQNLKYDELEREVLMIAGRTQVPFDQVITGLTTVLAKTKAQQYELVAKLGLQGYASAGRWADSVAALDKSLELAGDAMPPTYRVRIRYSQAEFVLLLDNPEAAAVFAKQSVEALGPCGASCTDKERAETIDHAYLLGRLFHLLFATANDRRFYQPAHDLYALTVALLPAAQQLQARKDSTTLEATLKNIKPGTGTHDKGALGNLLVRRDTEIQACYEAALGSNPTISGTLTIELESDASGAIKGVATTPRAGLADVSAVAGCVSERARQWKLPKRGMAGSTRIKLSFALALNKK
jgi:tetratricopeptide (TPR) repeat protein